LEKYIWVSFYLIKDEFVVFWVKTHQGGTKSKDIQTKFKMEGSRIMNNVDFDISNVSFETEGEVGDIKYRFHFFYTDPKTQKKKRIRFSFFFKFFSPWVFLLF
jgi:hypothetical protein